MSKSEKIASILKTLPTSPGVYQYFDETGELIYVGKAKNLKRRVSSYFNKEQTGKTRLLVSKIRDIRFTVVGSEAEAFLLENNFIKQYKPRYNIMLKDDKTYPWICVKAELFPRVFLTRKKVSDGSLYFGPYPSVMTAKTLLDILRQLYPIRTCKHNFKRNDIGTGHYRPCLEYQIGNCKAPCAGIISEDEYNTMISSMKEVIKGNISGVLKDLKAQMMDHAAKMEFEQAHLLKQKYDLLENYHSRSVVSSNTLHDMEVFSFDDADSSFYVNYMRITQGAVIQAFSIEMKRRLEETPEELLSLAVIELRQRFESSVKEVIVPIELDMELEDVRFTVPKKGEKLEVLNLSVRNARQYRAETEKLRSLVDPERHAMRVLTELQNDLHLPTLPEVIECFDNSNFQGDYAVAGMVQFLNGKPNKKEYRHFNIKTVEGPDDYASMKEVVRRRYTRLVEEGRKLPDLIITDGGKGQMEIVRQVIEDELHIEIPIAGLAKDDRHRTNELLYGFPPSIVQMKPNSELFRLLMFIQDEVHRFAISFHRKKFQKGFIHSELNNIKGIGKQTAEKLLLEFKSVQNIKSAGLQRLGEVIGQAKAKIVFDHFQGQTSSGSAQQPQNP
ncbi:MAG: excinuclease ABC subunit UvrC [Bacteroidales bacterium]|nr:excinuclease ABC subunit UvrC [Bacteroidales bacterium]